MQGNQYGKFLYTKSLLTRLDAFGSFNGKLQNFERFGDYFSELNILA